MRSRKPLLTGHVKLKPSFSRLSLVELVSPRFSVLPPSTPVLLDPKVQPFETVDDP